MYSRLDTNLYILASETFIRLFILKYVTYIGVIVLPPRATYIFVHLQMVSVNKKKAVRILTIPYPLNVYGS